MGGSPMGGLGKTLIKSEGGGSIVLANGTSDRRDGCDRADG